MPLIEKIINFSTRYRVLSHVLFWLGIFILLTSRYDPLDDDVSTIWKEMVCSLFWVFYVACYAYYIAYRIIPRLIKGRNYGRMIVELIIISYLWAAFSRIMVVHVLEPLVRTPPFNKEPVKEIMTDALYLFHTYLIHIISYAFFFIFIKQVKDLYLKNKRGLELEKQKAESELQVLRSQLNPHFLFNTLNNIYSLSLMSSSHTSPSIARLSEILDHLLYRCTTTYVPLSQEIALLKNYIGLEKLRYDDRLHVQFTHHTDRDAGIAPLILLSLAENAFKHGAGEDAGNPFIQLDLNLLNNVFTFEARNTFMQVKEKDESLKIGLMNIRKQLELIYPGRHQFSTEVKDGFFIARLQIDMSNN